MVMLTAARLSQRLLFDGNEAKYELWEVHFLAYTGLHKLHDVILAENEPKEMIL